MSTTGTGADNAQWFRPRGSLVHGDWEVAVVPASASTPTDWTHTSLRVVTLPPGGSVTHDTGAEEWVVVPLSGSATVEVAGVDPLELAGRPSVFDGPSDTAYVPIQSTLTVRAGATQARVALCGAAARTPRQPRRIDAEEAPAELRGAGVASREVRAFGLPPVLDADSILVCEVITPAGNWSSWPPHKHDEDRPGEESALEEIYYFETRATSDATADPVGFQRVYGTDDRPIDVLAEVRSGDVVLVPHGWHGPAIAAPDADLYYLNVMAGPSDERAWLIVDDPAHAAVRSAWTTQQVDVRLPFRAPDEVIP